MLIPFISPDFYELLAETYGRGAGIFLSAASLYLLAAAIVVFRAKDPASRTRRAVRATILFLCLAQLPLVPLLTLFGFTGMGLAIIMPLPPLVLTMWAGGAAVQGQPLGKVAIVYLCALAVLLGELALL